MCIESLMLVGYVDFGLAMSFNLMLVGHGGRKLDVGGPCGFWLGHELQLMFIVYFIYMREDFE